MACAICFGFHLVKFNIFVLHRYRFYVSLLLGGGEPGKICSGGEGTAASALLRSGDARQSCSFGEGMPARASPAERGRPEATVWRILCTLKERVNHWGLRLRVSYAASTGHPPPERRYTYRPSKHMYNFTYEDDFKIKNKYVAGISRTRYLSTEPINRPPQSRETIYPFNVSNEVSQHLFILMREKGTPTNFLVVKLSSSEPRLRWY
jgi:hypothetical protein